MPMLRARGTSLRVKVFSYDLTFSHNKFVTDDDKQTDDNRIP